MYVSMTAILTCFFRDVPYTDVHINLLEMYVSMTVILTCYFRDVRYNDGHITLLC
jgi:hypothetical protein